ncbi:MAG: protein jag [Lachnospiraceae bacterium]|nr:protein jag [Lachnospiraceae bacterium]
MDYVEFTGKTVDDALTEALVELEATSDKIEYEVIDKGSNGILGFIGGKPARIKVRKIYTLEDKVQEFLGKVFKTMNLEVKVDIDYNESEGNMSINLSGDEMGIIIGKRGQTIDSLQYIVSLVVNKESESYIRVKLDTENYRQRRRETLENLAKNIAYKVKRTRKSVSLEPMNPYERRIIHSALQNDKYVATKSDGEEPYRHVIVFLKH